MRAFLSKTIHSRRNDTQCAYYMQQSKTTVPIMHAPMIARQCQLTKYTYPTLSPAGQNPAHKSRVDQSPTKTPPPHLTRQHTHTRDTHVFNTAQPHVPTRAQPRNHLATTPTTQVRRREHGPTPFTITITCPRLSSHINRIRNTLFIAASPSMHQ